MYSPATRNEFRLSLRKIRTFSSWYRGRIGRDLFRVPRARVARTVSRFVCEDMSFLSTMDHRAAER